MASEKRISAEDAAAEPDEAELIELPEFADDPETARRVLYALQALPS